MGNVGYSVGLEDKEEQPPNQALVNSSDSPPAQDLNMARLSLFFPLLMLMSTALAAVSNYCIPKTTTITSTRTKCPTKSVFITKQMVSTITKTLPPRTVKTTRTITKISTATTTHTKCTATTNQTKCPTVTKTSTVSVPKGTTTITITTGAAEVKTKTITSTITSVSMDTLKITETSTETSTETKTETSTETKATTQVVTSTVISYTCPTPAEVFQNTDFEASDKDMAPWRVDTEYMTGEVSWGLEAGNSGSGEVVFAVRGGTGSWYGPALAQDVILCARHTYTISLSVAITDGCVIDVNLDYHMGFWGWPGIESTGGEWKRVSRTFEMNPDFGIDI
ncbi:hypothetical protein EDB80DRAFT_868331 [Ilyonectria destructans]|nr:hypothetical protein EDB80DRAFT_868331 [Ilyonectria destructans]